MVLREPRDREAGRGLAREVDAATLHPVEVATMLEEPELRDAPGAPAVAAEVVASRRALAAGTPTRFFCGAWEGRDGCNATLYSDGRTAQVENVGTVPDLRGHGLARAAVSLAIDAALADGHDLVLIFADDDDWPKELYAKLGFRTVGRVRTFLRSAPPASGDAAAG
jgi:ribosomal protein S18 acetylase RimI-like enzyme